MEVRAGADRGGAGAAGRGPRRLPSATVVLCTRDRAERVGVALGDLARQGGAEGLDAVLVDNGSQDATLEVLRRFASSGALATRVVSEPRAGLGRARNSGVAAAAGDVVVFVDDDCRLAPDHVLRLREWFASLPEEVAYVGGPVHAEPGARTRVALVEADGFRFFPPGAPFVVGQAAGANLAVRRAALVGVGGFDDRLGAGTPFRIEDADLCARLGRAGYAGAYVPGPVVVHAHGRGPAEARRLDRANDWSRGGFLALRLRQGDPAPYLRSWLRCLSARLGWRPRNLARAVAVTGREGAGVIAGLLSLRRRGPA